MIRTVRAEGLEYDATTDTATLRTGEPLPAASRDAQALLDARGFLVGVDLGGGPGRVAVMLGRHEDVARAVAAKVDVQGGRVRLAGGRALRAHEAGPYRQP